MLDQNYFRLVLNLKSSVKTQPWNAKLHFKVFYVSWDKKTFLIKLNMINCILLVLLLLVSMLLLKFTNSPLVIHFLNFVWLFHLYVLWIIILPVSLCNLLSLLVLNDYFAKILVGLFLKLRMQIFAQNFLFPTM